MVVIKPEKKSVKVEGCLTNLSNRADTLGYFHVTLQQYVVHFGNDSHTAMGHGIAVTISSLVGAKSVVGNTSGHWDFWWLRHMLAMCIVPLFFRNDAVFLQGRSGVRNPII